MHTISKEKEYFDKSNLVQFFSGVTGNWKNECWAHFICF